MQYDHFKMPFLFGYHKIFLSHQHINTSVQISLMKRNIPKILIANFTHRFHFADCAFSLFLYFLFFSKQNFHSFGILLDGSSKITHFFCQRQKINSEILYSYIQINIFVIILFSSSQA